MDNDAPDDYDALSQAAAEKAEQRKAADPAPAATKRDPRVLLLVVLILAWAGALAYAIPRLPADAPPVTYEERVAGALDALVAAAGFVDICLQAEPPQLPASLPAERFPGVSFEATGKKSYRLGLERDGEPIGLQVAEDGSWTLSGKGTEPYQSGGDE